jgi:hypothetical protein
MCFVDFEADQAPRAMLRSGDSLTAIGAELREPDSEPNS